MDKDKIMGAFMSFGSVVCIVVYGWLLYAFPTMILQITAFLAAATLFGILAWIGWTMATRPPLPPMEAGLPKDIQSEAVESNNSKRLVTHDK